MSGFEQDVSFSIVHPSLVDYCWKDAQGFLKKATDESNGRYDVEAVRQEVDDGRQQLWILFQGEDKMIAAITTMIVKYPLKRVLSIAFCGSDNNSNWYHHRDAIIGELSGWAAERECDGVEIVGRSGWEKVLKPLGFKKTFTTLEVGV